MHIFPTPIDSTPNLKANMPFLLDLKNQYVLLWLNGAR